MLRWRKRINSPGPQPGDCRFEPGTEHSWRSGRMGKVGGLSSRVICGFEARLRYCGVAKLVRRRPHKPESAGSKPVPATAAAKLAGRSFPGSSMAERPAVTRWIGVRVPAGERRTQEAVAQLVRAPGRQPGGRRFKSGQSRSWPSETGRSSVAAGPLGRLAQQAEDRLDKPKAGDSDPSATTMPRWRNGKRTWLRTRRLQVRVLLGVLNARLAQRESSGSTRRRSGVRIPDCALRTNRLARRPVVSQPAAGSIPVVLPGGSERRTAQLPVKQSPRHPWFDPRFRHACPRSAVENAPPSEGGDRWFESSRGH